MVHVDDGNRPYPGGQLSETAFPDRGTGPASAPPARSQRTTSELALDTTTQLLSDPSGSGKTTELHRLKGALQRATTRRSSTSASTTTRAVGTPRLIFVDAGLAGYLTTGAAADAPLGGLLENFVLGELARQLTRSQVSARLYHCRDRDQNEVDDFRGLRL